MAHGASQHKPGSFKAAVGREKAKQGPSQEPLQLYTGPQVQSFKGDLACRLPSRALYGFFHKLVVLMRVLTK